MTEAEPQPAGTCAGYCCEAFIIGSPEEVARLGERYGDDGKLVGEIVIHLGQFSTNPTGRIPAVGTPVTPGIGPHFHTCKEFCTETRKCKIYERRPNMCRKYPNGHYCEFDGCDHGPTRGPDVGLTKTQIIARNERRRKFAMFDRVARRSAEIIPEGMKKVFVTLTRPATESAVVSLVVPEDSDEKQIEAYALSGMRRLGGGLGLAWSPDEGNTPDMDSVVAHVLETVGDPDAELLAGASWDMPSPRTATKADVVRMAKAIERPFGDSDVEG